MAVGSNYTFTKRYILQNEIDDVEIVVVASALNPRDGTNLSVSYSLNDLLDENTVSYADGLEGEYVADYEDVEIIITSDDYGYYLTYITPEITLERILYDEEFSNVNDGRLWFSVDGYYPEYEGYVEIMYSADGVIPYNYSSYGCKRISIWVMKK